MQTEYVIDLQVCVLPDLRGHQSNFNPPNGNRSQTAFGTITQIATGTTPRQVQLGVKVYF